MKIVIIGLGTIGKTILKNLSGEGHTITIIDEDKAKVEMLIEKYDVFGVVGNGACIDIQKEANTEANIKTLDLDAIQSNINVELTENILNELSNTPTLPQFKPDIKNR